MIIDDKALNAAYEEYLAADRYDPYPDVIDMLRAAITAYLDTAAPLPGAGEPVAWRWQGGNTPLGRAWCYSAVNYVKYAEPLYTAAPDTAQAVALEREACAKLLDDAATHLDQTGALKAAVRRLFKLADEMRARGAKP